MNKLLTKIVGAALGVAMTVGVGVAVATSANKDIQKAEAADITYSFTINDSNFDKTGSGSGYAAYNGDHTITATQVGGSATMEVTYNSNQVMNGIQWQKNNGVIYNKTDLGTVNSVSITKSAGSFTTTYGTTQNPSSGSQGTGKGYFKIAVGGATGTVSAITVNFTISTGSSKTPTSTSVTATNDKTVLNYEETVQLIPSVTYGTSTSVPGATVTYSSSDSTIASVNATTGLVTASSSKSGTVVITATYAGNDTYDGSSGTISITVRDPNAIDIIPSQFSEITQDEVDQTISGIHFNITNGTTTTEVRIFKNATLTISATRNITNIVLECSANGTAKYGPGAFGTGAPEGYTFESEGKLGTWVGTAKSVAFTASSEQVRVVKFTITLEPLTPISTLTIDSTHSMYEGQTWTPTVTYNDSATVKTSEIQIVSGSEYIEIVNGTSVKAKNGAVATTATAVVKAHATDVESSEVYSNTCSITINHNSVTGVSIKTAPTKVDYVEGQKLSLAGLVLTITWNVGETEINSTTGYEGVTTNPSLNTSLTVSDHYGTKVAVTYGAVSTLSNQGFQISVVAKAVTGITNWTDATLKYSLGSILVADGTLHVTYNDETTGELSVATLWNDSQATFEIGEDSTWVSVTPGLTEMVSNYNNKKLRITYSGFNRYVTIQVKEFNVQFLTAITSASEIVSGESYVIGVHLGDNTYLLPSSKNGLIDAELNSDAWIDDTFGSNTVSSMRADMSSYAYTFTSVTDGFALQDANGKYLGWDNPSSSKTQLMSYNTEQSNGKTTWAISYEAYEWGSFRFTTQAGDKSRSLAFSDAKTSDAKKFGAYSSSNITSTKHDDNNNYYYLLEVYKVLDVSDTILGSWSETVNYVNEITCNISGSYSFGEGKSWNTMANNFADLEVEVKAYFKHASYEYDAINNVTTPTNGTNSDVASFVSMYDYVVDKYSWTDFIGRNNTTYDLFNSSERINYTYQSASQTAAIISVIAVLSLSAVAGYFMLRKRKEQ